MRAAVLGSPIAHSLSPVLHRAAYAAMGLTDWRYDAFECGEEDLAGFLDRIDETWAGLSLTMPLKRVALKLADRCGKIALAVGGANTLIFREGMTLAENTDVYGIVTALTEAGLGGPSSALVLGGGATAGSALVALRELGLERATLAVRDRTRAGEAADAGQRAGLTVEIRTLAEPAELLPGTELVVSTLPGGAADPYAQQWGPEIAAAGAALFDVVYAPWPTALGAAVRSAGGVVLGGFPMLLHQAVRQVSLMTGRQDVPVEAMRAAGESELAARQALRRG
jgi:shikimate dehydrogenase